MVLEGDEAVEVVRRSTARPTAARRRPGTIRGDLSLSNRENLVHGSDSPESAEREIAIWFPGSRPRRVRGCPPEQLEPLDLGGPGHLRCTTRTPPGQRLDGRQLRGAAAV